MSYDVVTVGRGLGGAGFAKLMAARGAKVLVLERPTEFRDPAIRDGRERPDARPSGSPGPDCEVSPVNVRHRQAKCPRWVGEPWRSRLDIDGRRWEADAFHDSGHSA
jgi:flavin-dependent dehydrogenase